MQILKITVVLLGLTLAAGAAVTNASTSEAAAVNPSLNFTF